MMAVRGNASRATAARPFFVPAGADTFGAIFSDGFESGDVSAWSTSKPEDLLNRKLLRGLQTGEKLTGVDSIPPSGEKFTGVDSIPPSQQSITISGENDNQVIGISNLGRVFNINCDTSVATLIGSVPSFFTNPFNSTETIGFDINPITGDKTFTNTEEGPSVLVNSTTSGFVFKSLFYPSGDPGAGQTPKIISMAYTNVFSAATNTSLFGIDSNRDTLVSIDETTGETKTIGPLGVNTSAIAALDIAPKNNESEADRAFGAFTLQGENKTRFYSVNLQTGAATEIGTIGDGTNRFFTFTLVRPVSLSLASCDISPSSIRKRTGTQHTFNVTVSLDGQPVSGAQVGVNITSGPNQGFTGTAATNQNGQASFAYTSNNQPGSDTIQASGTAQGNAFSCTATVEWTALLIESVTPNTGGSGNHLTLTGIFRRGDGVEINEQAPKSGKIKYKNCDSNDNCFTILIKKADKFLNQCPSSAPVTNQVKVFRPNSASPAITDTSAFATCP